MPARSKARDIPQEIISEAMELYYGPQHKSTTYVQGFLAEKGYKLSRGAVWLLLKRKTAEYRPTAIEGMIAEQGMTIEQGLNHLINYLTIINESLHSMLAKEGGVGTASLPKVLLAISEGRKTLEAIERVQAKMPRVMPTPQETFNRLVEIMKEAEVPIEYLERMSKLWEEKYSKQPTTSQPKVNIV